MQQEINSTQNVALKKPRIFLITLGIIIILILSMILVVNAYPQLIFSPKTIYLAQEGKNLHNLKKDLDSFSNNSFIKDYLQIFENPVKVSSHIKFQAASLSQIKNPQALKLYQLLKDSTLSIEQYMDFKNQKDKNSISVKLKDKELLSFDTFSTNDKTGILINPIYNKYITFDKNNLEQVYQKLQIKDGPSKIISSYDLLKIIKMPYDDKRYINNKSSLYLKSLISNIDKEDVTLIPKQIVEIGDARITTNLLSLKLNEQKLRDIYVEILEDILKDDRLLEITVGRYAELLNLYKNANYQIDQNLLNNFKDVSSIKKLLNKQIESLKSDKTNKISFVMNIYVDKSSKIVKREIKLIENSTNNAYFTFDYTKLKSNKNSYSVVLDINAYRNGKKQSIFSINGTSNGNEGKYRIGASGADGKTSYSDITTTYEKDKKLSFKADLKETMDNGYFSYTLNKASQEGAYNLTSEFGLSTGKIIVNSSINYKSPFELPNVSSKELNLNTVAAENLQREFMTIYISTLQFMQKYSYIFN